MTRKNVLTRGNKLYQDQDNVWLLLEGNMIPGVQILGRFKHDRELFSLSPHVHDANNLEICYFARGKQRYKVADQEYCLEGGDVLVVLPGDAHMTLCELEPRGLIYFLRLSVPNKSQCFLGQQHPEGKRLLEVLLNCSQRHFRGTPILGRHIDAAISSFLSRKTDALSVLHMQNELLSFLLEVLRCAAVHSDNNVSPWAQRACDFVRDHITEPLDISGLAKGLRISVPRLKSQFKEELGIPPADYILREKIGFAKERLLDTEGTITDIAFDLGFSSSQYFATVFKRYTGLTPSQFVSITNTAPSKSR